MCLMGNFICFCSLCIAPFKALTSFGLVLSIDVIFMCFQVIKLTFYLEKLINRYKNHNLVDHGWKNMIYKEKSWVAINSGVFLIRNCQWSLEFMEVWSSMGPQSLNYDKWGKSERQRSSSRNLAISRPWFTSSLKEKEKWGDKIYLAGEYYFEGYWLEIVETLDNITEKYVGIEKEVPRLRQGHAEKVSKGYAEMMEAYLKEAGYGQWSWRRPFITHFTGCQPCSGKHNQMYSGESCWDGMQRALNFDNNQVLHSFGFVHPDYWIPPQCRLCRSISRHKRS